MKKLLIVGLMALFTVNVIACDLDSARSAAQDASDFSRKAKNADAIGLSEKAYEYSKRAYNASEDVISFLSDCEDNIGENH